MNKLVLFRDTLDDSVVEEHYGILLDDGNILCLCCMGIVENGDYVIIDDEIELDLDHLISKELGV